ncbi:MAG: 50S ribosomal protein L35 [Candidatus Schekmanbacteria bacterium]|nr:50S ribosomal protein L35 [Candidatus Schekmanbacteria bacterium]
MPKMKSCRSAYKRFSFTGTGKVKRNNAYKSHMLTKKSRKRKRRLRQGEILAQCDRAKVQRLLPYGKD